MSKLLAAMATIEAVFSEYAGRDGDGSSLSKKELGELLRVEFGIKDSGNNKDLDKFFGSLDQDGDNVVDYDEFLTLVVALVSLMKKC